MADDLLICEPVFSKHARHGLKPFHICSTHPNTLCVCKEGEKLLRLVKR